MEKELGYGGGGGVGGWKMNLGMEEELRDGKGTWVWRRSWGWRRNLGMEQELGMEKELGYGGGGGVGDGKEVGGEERGTRG